MGKANKKKNRVKKKRSSLSIGTDKKGTSQVIYWEYLMDCVGKITNSIINNSAMITQIYKEAEEELKSNTELAQLMNGFRLSLEDITKETREAMEKHVTFGEDGTIASNLKGKVRANVQSDVDKFLNLSNRYLVIMDKLESTSSNAYLNIFTKLKAYDQDKFKNIEEAIIKGNKEKQEDLKDLNKTKEKFRHE